MVNFCHFGFKFFLLELSFPRIALTVRSKVRGFCSSLKRAGWQYSWMPHSGRTSVRGRMRSLVTISCAFPLEVFFAKLSTMFFLMTVNAQIFPIRSVRRIVHMISVLMVDRQLVSVLVVKLPPTLGANEPVDLKGTLTIITLRETRLLQLFHGFIDRFAGALFPAFWISSVLDFFNHDDP